ncbi:MAG: TlpA disulfide reductase family protein [Pyrinomonadaceae bacterium]
MTKYLVLLIVSFFFCGSVYSQPKKPIPPPLFYDSDGKPISNNEFVDIRMANFHYPDATLVKTLGDGTVEFRLQKVPQEGMSAPVFSVKTVDGKTLNSSDLKGKVVVLGFWFIGCPACLNIEPKLNAFKEKFRGESGVVFIAMTPDAVREVKKYLAKQPFDFIQAVDARTAMNSFVFAGFPKNIVIGRDGKIVYWRSTIHAWDKFESVVRAELAKN